METYKFLACFSLPTSHNTPHIIIDEFHSKKSEGSLGLSCPHTQQAQWMLAKQACHHLASRAPANIPPRVLAGHQVGQPYPNCPFCWPHTAWLSSNAVCQPPWPSEGSFQCVDCITTANLQEAKWATIYKELTAIPCPPQRIVRVQPKTPSLGTPSVRGCRTLVSNQWQWTPTSLSFMTSNVKPMFFQKDNLWTKSNCYASSQIF